MKLTRTLNSALPEHDYRPALQSALGWLGDRYLLARPVNRVSAQRRPFFAETKRWMPAARD